MPHTDVLVVDDDAATRTLLERLMARIGLSVQTASDGAEAAKALASSDFDAIVMDLFMPRMNGTDLLDALTGDRSHLLRHVIVLSAAPESLLRETRNKYPIWCAMRKPADISELMENVLDCVVDVTTGSAAVSSRN
jgi:two-component system sensor histidine kinase RpfC